MDGFNPQIQEVNIFNLTQSITDLYSDLLDQKNIQLNNTVDKDLSHDTDPEIVHTVLRNLLMNAIKFSMEGGSIHIGAKKEGETLKLYVRDQGEGISKENLENLFTAKKSKLGTAGELGTGMGLSLCHNLVKKINGRLDVESVLFKGSTFTIMLT